MGYFGRSTCDSCCRFRAQSMRNLSYLGQSIIYLSYIHAVAAITTQMVHKHNRYIKQSIIYRGFLYLLWNSIISTPLYMLCLIHRLCLCTI